MIAEPSRLAPLGFFIFYHIIKLKAISNRVNIKSGIKFRKPHAGAKHPALGQDCTSNRHCSKNVYYSGCRQIFTLCIKAENLCNYYFNALKRNKLRHILTKWGTEKFWAGPISPSNQAPVPNLTLNRPLFWGIMIAERSAF